MKKQASLLKWLHDVKMSILKWNALRQVKNTTQEGLESTYNYTQSVLAAVKGTQWSPELQEMKNKTIALTEELQKSVTNEIEKRGLKINNLGGKYYLMSRSASISQREVRASADRCKICDKKIDDSNSPKTGMICNFCLAHPDEHRPAEK